MTIKTHGRMFTDNTVGITQLDLQDGTANQAIVTDGQGVLRFATVGAGGSVGSSVYVEDIRTGDGTTATFTLSTEAPYEESILVFIDGVAQPTASFTLPSTTSITFSPAPGNGAAIRICHLGIASSVADNSITGAKIAMGGDTPGDILYYNGADYQRLTIGTAGQILATNNAVNAPVWVNADTSNLPATGVDGNVLTSDGTNWASEAPLGGVGGELVSIQTFPPPAQNNIALNTTTWTRPAGVKRIEVHLVGAGGWGQGDTSSGVISGGGGAGGYCIGVYDVTNLATATIIVGASNDAAGVMNSSFSGTGITTMNANGGQAQNQQTAGGAGGTATGGMVNFPGEAGTASTGSTTSGGPTGGNSSFGGPYGNGVNGVTNNRVLGANGYCYIKEYSDVSASLVGEKLISTQSFTANGTWTKPANITKIKVQLVGGGGGSADVTGSAGATGGGGGGGYCLSIFDVSNITTGAVVIGQGSVWSSGSHNGPTNSTFTATGVTTMTAGGGGHTESTVAGTAGVAAGGQLNINGASGGTRSLRQHGGFAAGPFGGHIGHGAAGTTGSQASHQGTAGYCLIYEYSDASLVSGGSLVPTGVVNPYAGATAPAGWLLCFGQAISRTVYSTLFTAIGTTYGVGDGSTTFALPDMRGRAVAGQDDMGGTSANRLTTPINGDTLGAVGGSESSLAHSIATSGVTTTTHADQYSGGGTGWTMHTTATSQLPPTIILNYIIKT